MKQFHIRFFLTACVVVLFLLSGLGSAVVGIKQASRQDLSSKINLSTRNAAMVCCVAGGTSTQKLMSNEACESLQQVFSAVVEANAIDPCSEKTRMLKTRFIEALLDLGLLPQKCSVETIHSLLEPPWQNTDRSPRWSKLLSSRPLDDENNATLLFCSMAGTGWGFVIPPFLLPRPRLLMQWRGFYPDSSVVSIAEMATGRGVIARGTQIGTAFGFIGIGFAFALPGAPAKFGFLGYSLMTSLQAADISWYYANFPPLVMDESPEDGAWDVPVSLSELRFTLKDYDQDTMTYSVVTSPDIGSGSEGNVGNGAYSVPVSGLDGGTTYTWTVRVSDGTDTVENAFTFTTAAVAPVITNPQPTNNAQYVSIWRSNVSFDLKDYQGELMDWTVETQPDIGSGAATGVGDGRYTVVINGLEYLTEYRWFVNATDETYWTRKIFEFRTTPEGLFVLEPSADTDVKEHEPTINYGSSGSMLVSDKYGATSNYDARSMVLFDLSEIPSGSTIISANFSLYYFGYWDTNPVGREITCHRILEDWDEMTVTYHSMPDSNPIECASTILPGYFTWVDWDVTAEVDDFINSGVNNYGWMIRDYKSPWGGPNIPQQLYYSSNAVDLHPMLFIEFTPP